MANYSNRGEPISLIVIHTNEGPYGANAASNLANWMAGQEVSYHKIVDDDTIVTPVPDNMESWSILSGNGRSLNLCFIGYSAQSRATWLQHDAMLRRGALAVRNWCAIHNIPINRLTPADVGANRLGICGHVDWTLGKHDGTHTDPGNGFPWDLFISYVKGQVIDDMPTPQELWDYPITDDGSHNPTAAWQRVSETHLNSRQLMSKCDNLTKRLEETVTAILARWAQEDAARKALMDLITVTKTEVEEVKAICNALAGAKPPTTTTS
jgi:hypothetical protein